MFQFQSKATKLIHNDLFDELDHLKKILNDPEKYMWEHFYDIKNEIDLEFEELLFHLSADGEDDSYDLKTVWISIINEIDKFKVECLEKLHSFQFNLTQFNEAINIIEDNLKLAIKSKNILDTFTDKQQKCFENVKKSIDEQNYSICKYLFGDKTIVYLNRKKCNEYELLNEFSSTETNTYHDLIGRLLIIKDYYLKDIDYINLFSR